MNREDNDFSLEDSEELINNLKSHSAPEFEKLRSTLNLLSHVNELSPISIPPVLPSEIGQSVQLLARKSSKSRRTVITSILSIGILASASLAAAAVSGRGPAPIVNAGRESARLVKAVAGAVSKAVTGNNEDSPTAPTLNSPGAGNESDEKSENSERSLTGPSSLPSSASEDNKSNSDSNDNEGNSISITASPSTKSEHSGDKGSKESGKSAPTSKPEPTSSAGDESSNEEND
ncbi:MAG: hypothetical protein HY050_06375 [Actinobacteria bacterium]|nr:hypothetical protein [Actinomycetota bacterium]